jgi:hypothetical protein
MVSETGSTFLVDFLTQGVDFGPLDGVRSPQRQYFRTGPDTSGSEDPRAERWALGRARSK